MKKKVIIGVSVVAVVIIAVVLCLFLNKDKKDKKVVDTAKVKSVEVRFKTESVTLESDKAKELTKAIDDAKLKSKDGNIPKGWVYQITIVHDNGDKDVLTIVDDTTLVYNDKLYSGSGITIALLDRLSGIKRQ
jgi:hypothetical protein